jgi:dTDP-4-dehydrorhamnose 3,5-epimerase
MEFEKLDIDGAWIIRSPVFKDERGKLREYFRYHDSHKKTGLIFDVVQSMYSESKKGVIRGIHYSLSPNGQWKVITCISGAIFDVIVDIRIDSPTFGKVQTVELTSENGLSVLMQANLGHAFQAMSEIAIVSYNLNMEYHSDLESGINPLDSLLDIQWPVSPKIFSQKDRIAPGLMESKKFGKLPGDKSISRRHAE